MNSIKRILTPSSFEIVAWLYLTIAGLGACYYYLLTQAPEVMQYFEYQQSTPSGIYQQYGQFTDVINQSKFAADAAVFAIWAGVGLLGYIGIEMILKLVGSSWRFSILFFDRNEDKEYLVESTLGAFLMKLLGVSLLLVSAYLFIGLLFPLGIFKIDMLQQSALNITTYVLSFALSVGAIIHIGSVCMRLIVQRERIFFDR